MKILYASEYTDYIELTLIKELHKRADVFVFDSEASHQAELKDLLGSNYSCFPNITQGESVTLS